MTKMRDVFRRADRAAAMALLLAVATVAGAATSGYHPHTDHQSTVQLRGSVTGADRMIVPMPKPMPASVRVFEPAPALLSMAKFASEERCLAEAMYYEARGEGVRGQMAIAEVIFHRMHRRGYPSSICGVVYQGASEGTGCQFSFACDGELDRPKSAAAWAHANQLAMRILNGFLMLDNETDGATSFHAIDVEPDWAATLERTVQIGNHVFYRPAPRTRAS